MGKMITKNLNQPLKNKQRSALIVVEIQTISVSNVQTVVIFAVAPGMLMNDNIRL